MLKGIFITCSVKGKEIYQSYYYYTLLTAIQIHRPERIYYTSGKPLKRAGDYETGPPRRGYLEIV